MNIYLHGALFNTNFGDIIFADIFYKKVIALNGEQNTYFFDSKLLKTPLSEFCKNVVGYNKKQTLKNLLKADLLIYISGGMFALLEKSWRRATMNFLKFAVVGLLFAIRKKKVLILGVGGGPVNNRVLLLTYRYIFNHAEIVTVRNEETKEYFKKCGVKKDMEVTSDTAQIIDQSMIPPLDTNIKIKIDSKFKNKRKLFLHINDDKTRDGEMSENIIPAVNEFLSVNNDWGVVISTDKVYNGDVRILRTVKALDKTIDIFIYPYNDPWQLCSLLNECDMVITAKLHVGIISAALGKSVVSFPHNKEKITRYYNQINESDRCIPLKDINPAQALDVLNQFCYKPINIDAAFREKAKINLKKIDEVLKSKFNKD